MFPKLLNVYKKLDKETLELLGKFAAKCYSMTPNQANNYLKRLLKSELNHNVQIIDTIGESNGSEETVSEEGS